MHLPPQTYHVITQWPDGTLVTVETRMDRDDAFDVASDCTTKFRCEVRVEVVERDERGLPTMIADVTDEWRSERFGEVAA